MKKVKKVININKKKTKIGKYYFYLNDICFPGFENIKNWYGSWKIEKHILQINPISLPILNSLAQFGEVELKFKFIKATKKSIFRWKPDL